MQYINTKQQIDLSPSNVFGKTVLLLFSLRSACKLDLMSGLGKSNKIRFANRSINRKLDQLNFAGANMQ